MKRGEMYSSPKNISNFQIKISRRNIPTREIFYFLEVFFKNDLNDPFAERLFSLRMDVVGLGEIS